MMNVLTLFLVATSLAAAGVWSPSPAGRKEHSGDQNGDVLVRDGHRAVVVEYDDDGQENTKVSISSEDEGHGRVAGAVSKNVKERIKEAASVNLGQGLSYSAPEAQPPSGETETPGDRSRGPRELICDAYGKCKHKIADSINRAKSSVSHKTEDLQEEAGDVIKTASHRAQDTALDAAEVVREGASRKAQDLKRAVSDTAEKAKNRASDASRVVAETAQKGSDASWGVPWAAQDVKQAAAEVAQKGKEGAVSTAKTAGNHILSNVTAMIEEVEEAVSPERLSQAINVVNLLGFATAFGMSVWISFINSSLLGRAIPRHQFGVVQSKIYPVYFKAMAISIGAALLAHLFGQRKRLSEPVESNQACNLLVSLLMVLFNAYVVEPRATKTMFDRIKIEKEEGRGRGSEEPSHTADKLSPAIADESQAQPVTDPAVTAATACASVPTPFPERAEDDRIRAHADELNTKLKRFNSCSSLLNQITFLGLTWHLVYLGYHLRRC